MTEHLEYIIINTFNQYLSKFNLNNIIIFSNVNKSFNELITDKMINIKIFNKLIKKNNKNLLVNLDSKKEFNDEDEEYWKYEDIYECHLNNKNVYNFLNHKPYETLKKINKHLLNKKKTLNLIRRYRKKVNNKNLDKLLRKIYINFANDYDIWNIGEKIHYKYEEDITEYNDLVKFNLHLYF